jgi:hypothetical protein
MKDEIFKLNDIRGYDDSINHLSGITGSLNTVTNQMSILSSSLYETGLTTVISGLSDKLTSLNSISSILPNITIASDTSPFLSLSREATTSLASLHSSTNLPGITSVINSNIEPWYTENIAKVSMLSTSVLSGLNISATTKSLSTLIGVDSLSSIALSSGIAKATELALFSEKSLYGVTNENLGIQIGIEDGSKKYLSLSSRGLATGYSDLMKSFQTDPLSYVNINPALSKQASIEYFTSANLLETISIEEDICFEEEVIKNKILYENEISLNEYLPKIDSGLYRMWQGAIEAYHSENTDKIRHFVTSIRELFTHLMQKLAPDKEIRSWTSEESLFHEKRPTRKARLLYICRNISNDPFNKFVNKDVEATLAFIDIFQRGTHKINPYFTSNHLLTIKSKAEGTLKFLLEIHFKSE